MKSMTGFAKRQCNINGRTLSIEIKTLNSKQIDAIVKLPQSLKEHELEIRSFINRLERGKIELVITEESDNRSESSLNVDLATNRYNELKKLTATLGCDVTDSSLLSMVMQQPEIWDGDEESVLSDEEWQSMASEINATIDVVDSTRKHEGEILKMDFVKHIDLIEKYLKEIPQYEQERIATAKERIRTYLADAAVKNVDENRFEQELIYYLEKLDITEEKVRLAKHIDYFRDVMEHEESSGKKLGFIAQEMGREINTTGSKANHVEIQRLVVAMKDELEKIKEQLGNIL